MKIGIIQSCVTNNLTIITYILLFNAAFSVSFCRLLFVFFLFYRSSEIKCMQVIYSGLLWIFVYKAVREYLGLVHTAAT